MHIPMLLGATALTAPAELRQIGEEVEGVQERLLVFRSLRFAEGQNPLDENIFKIAFGLI